MKKDDVVTEGAAAACSAEPAAQHRPSRAHGRSRKGMPLPPWPAGSVSGTVSRSHDCFSRFDRDSSSSELFQLNGIDSPRVPLSRAIRSRLDDVRRRELPAVPRRLGGGDASGDAPAGGVDAQQEARSSSWQGSEQLGSGATRLATSPTAEPPPVATMDAGDADGCRPREEDDRRCKRRRTGGKQTPRVADAEGGLLEDENARRGCGTHRRDPESPNSLQGAVRTGPSRSSTSTLDRVACALDRDGHAPTARRGAVQPSWSPWRGRPPDAHD